MLTKTFSEILLGSGFPFSSTNGSGFPGLIAMRPTVRMRIKTNRMERIANMVLPAFRARDGGSGVLFVIVGPQVTVTTMLLQAKEQLPRRWGSL
jgi:hypothetical protein